MIDETRHHPFINDIMEIMLPPPRRVSQSISITGQPTKMNTRRIRHASQLWTMSSFSSVPYIPKGGCSKLVCMAST